MKFKILLIDDEDNIAQMLKIKLEHDQSYQVEIANSGQEGLAKAEEEKFDLVITDYSMPNMNGEEVLDALKKDNPKLPVFIFTVYYDDDSTIVDRIRAKADAIINKPLDFGQLYQAIAAVQKK